MKSVYGKLIGGFLITIIFSFSVSGYISLKSNYDQIERNGEEELFKTNTYIANIIENTKEEKIYAAIKSFADNSEYTITLYSQKDGYIFFGDKEIAPDIEEIKRHWKSNDAPYQIASNVLSYGQLRYTPSGEEYYIYVQRDTGQEKGVFANSAFLIFGCVFLSGSVVFLAIADIIVKPITKLTRATMELSSGNYSVRVNYTGDDEISRLNQGFNQMAQQLAKHEETRQKFISDVSHEFQTPLTAIQGFANILKEEDLPKAQREKYADIILFHSKRLSTLSKNMLQLTLLENEEVQLEMTNFSIVSQLSRVISTHENQAATKKIEIQFEKPKKDIMIDGDEQRLEQVWMNLISNAIKYTGENGLIIVSVKRTSKDIEVHVEDTGSGMSKEVLSHIFDRFYRADKARGIEGNGLGLAIVKSIVELHKGSIDVESQVDIGSTFIVKLPGEKALTLRERLQFNK